MTGAARAALAPALAVVGGLLLLISHPPVGLWPATLLAPALLLAALHVDDRQATDDGRALRAGRLGLWFGLAAFAPMLTWLIMPAGMIGYLLLMGVQAAWMGLGAWIIRPHLRRWWLPVVTAAVWTGVDAWRAIVPLNGFEWGALAYAHVDGSWLLPLARLLGGRGITLVAVLLSALGFEVVRRLVRDLRGRARTELEHAMAGAQRMLLALVAVLLASVLATIEPPATTGESLEVLAVQGNDIRHWEESVADAPTTITTAMRDLTLEATRRDGPADLTVWPESSIDRDFTNERGAGLAPLVADAADAVPTLLAGANLDGPDPETEFRNTLLELDDDAEIVEDYDKHRLVPFGEYVPFRSALEWFPPLEQIPRDGQPGPRGQQLTAAGARVAPVICFETVFSGVVRDNVLGDGQPAEVLVVVTNNASFGDSAQPAQHLTQTRMRAVETGRYAVHAALSGASAFVAPDGTASQVTEPFTKATIRERLPLVDGLTPFLAIGDVVSIVTRAAVVAGAAWALWLAVARRRARRRAGGLRRDARGEAEALR